MHVIIGKKDFNSKFKITREENKECPEFKEEFGIFFGGVFMGFVCLIGFDFVLVLIFQKPRLG